MRALLADDDLMLAKRVRRQLTRGGLAVDVAVTGADALWMAQATEYDVVVLAGGLPDVAGREVCRRLREEDVTSPVLILGSAPSVHECIAGLDSGADDYLAKPFHAEELAARLRALTRRGPALRPVVLEAADLRLDVARRRVTRGGVELELSVKEFALLAEFMRHPGHVLSRFHLLEHVWDGEYENRSNIVDVYVRYLRGKIDRPFGTDTIETIRGAGYRLHDRAPETTAVRHLEAVA
jgi:two-component system OmpR family response regulator